MAERPEDLNLPISVVQRIIKESLPDGVNVSKEARQTISRASSVFVLYLTACAVSHSNKAKRKTLGVNDIFSAINDMEFDSFANPLKTSLENRKESITAQSAIKKNTTNNKSNTGESKESEIEICSDNEEEADNGGEGGVDHKETKKDTKENKEEEEGKEAEEDQVKKRKLSKADSQGNDKEEEEE